jgi:hypothetical protein
VRLSVVAIALAVLALVVPIAPEVVETRYSQSVYLSLQNAVTPVTNRVPIALLDVGSAVVLVFGLALAARQLRTYSKLHAFARIFIGGLGIAAGLYLVFLCMWGFNYRRVPLESKLQYDATRVTRPGALALARRAVTEINALAALPRASTVDTTALAAAFAEAQRSVGHTRFAAIGLPKTSLAGLYFRYAALDGMTDPYFLEILLNPDLPAFETPAVLAHEWAHLAGYADESEANFIAWLTCVRADPLSRYSGWLDAYLHLSNGVSREDRRELRALLHPNVVADLQAIAARYERSSPTVRQAARTTYDTYLRAHRVEEGVASYAAVVRLMLGTSFDAGWVPRKR